VTMWLITVEALMLERLCGPQRSTNVLKLIPWEVVVGAKPPTRGQSRILRRPTRKEEILFCEVSVRSA